MRFNSKTALIEHIKELVNAGYLEEDWITQDIDGKTTAKKIYHINFKAVKDDEDPRGHLPWTDPRRHP